MKSTQVHLSFSPREGIWIYCVNKNCRPGQSYTLGNWRNGCYDKSRTIDKINKEIGRDYDLNETN